MQRLSLALPAGSVVPLLQKKYPCPFRDANALCFREELPKDLAKESNVNKETRAALNKIFPGYEVGR